jgi:MSHA pilin protein MshA
LALARNQTAATGSVDLEGATIATVFGYPAGSATGIELAIGNLENYDYSSSGGATTFKVKGASGAGATDCAVVYTQPAAAGAVPVISFDETNC